MPENEPSAPRCLRSGSLGYAPTTGMRIAPEVLVFELFRELGYGDSRNTKVASAMDFREAIKHQSISGPERLLLDTCRGARRRGRSRIEYFYAPPYSGLSRHAWFRKKSDRTMRAYFLGGPLAHQAARGELETNLVVDAVVGNRSVQSLDAPCDSEFLSLVARDERNDPPASKIASNLNAALEARSTLLKGNKDPLAELMTEDFLEICRLEGTIPRREWIFFLTAYLCVATATWMMAHLKVTLLIRDWLLKACEQEDIPSFADILDTMRRRSVGLLHPSSSPTREVFQHVEEYMQSRVELRLLVRAIERANGASFMSSDGQSKKLSLGSMGARWLPLLDILELARNMDWKRVTGGPPVRQWLTRSAETWPNWRSPRTRGQGKNIDEFLRVLYRQEEDDSGGGLLIRCRGGTAKIVPGHRLLQLFAFLAVQRKARLLANRDRGKLVLRDLESHFFDYGIDFRSSSYGRPLLMDKLVEGGFLTGSPDAGESAEVLNTVGKRRNAP